MRKAASRTRANASAAFAIGSDAGESDAGENDVGDNDDFASVGAASVGSDQPAAKRARLQTCSLCGESSSSRAWAAKAIHKKTKAETPVEDKCARCHAFSRKFMWWLKWDDIIEVCKRDKTFHAELMSGLASYERKECPTSFKQEAVNTSVEAGIDVGREGFFLSKHELEAALGGTDPDRIRGLKKATGVNEHGEKVKGFMLADPAKPWRTFRIFGVQSESRTCPRLATSDHHFASQSTRVMAHLTQQRCDKGLGRAISRGCLKTVDELKRELEMRPVGDAGEDGDNDSSASPSSGE